MATSGFVKFFDVLTNPDGPVSYKAPAASETLTLGPDENVIRVTLPASGAGILKLPPKVEAAGRMFSFTVVSDGGGEVQIVDDGGSDVISDNLGAATDYALIYCDGFKYFLIVETTT